MNAKVVGISKEIVSRYPAEWRSCCLELLVAYRELRQEEFGADYKWTRICNEIIQFLSNYHECPEDYFTDVLRRQDFEHWEKGSMGPKDDKFQHIDLFIQLKLAHPKSKIAAAKKSVIEHRQSTQIKALHSLIVGDWIAKNEEHYSYFDFCMGKLFVLTGTNHAERIAIYFPNFTGEKYNIILFSFPSSVEDVDAIIKNSQTYFGHLIPMSRFSGSIDQMMIEAKAIVFDRISFRSAGVLPQKFSTIFFNTNSNELALLPFRDRTNTFWQPDWVFTKDSFGSDGTPFNEFIPFSMGRVFVELRNTIISESQRSFFENLLNEHLLW